MKKSEFMNILRTLSLKNSFEIISYCSIKPRTVLELSKLLDAPYTSVKDRLVDLVDFGILMRSNGVNPNTRRSNVLYKTIDFQYIIDPRKISAMVVEG